MIVSKFIVRQCKLVSVLQFNSAIFFGDLDMRIEIAEDSNLYFFGKHA